MRRKSTILTLAYLAMYVALYIVLKYVGNLIPFLQMPNGGSIELELVAVFICSYHLGWQWGIVDGLCSLFISFMFFQPYYVSVLQMIFDYVLPLVSCGAASLLWPFKQTGKTMTIIMGLIIACGAFFGIVNSYGASVIVYAVSALIAIAMFAFTYWYLNTKKKFGIVIAMLLKYLWTVLSGVYFWFPEGSAAGSREAWIFSIGYNLWYNLVTMIVCIIIVPMLIDRLSKVTKFKA